MIVHESEFEAIVRVGEARSEFKAVIDFCSIFFSPSCFAQKEPKRWHSLEWKSKCRSCMNARLFVLHNNEWELNWKRFLITWNQFSFIPPLSARLALLQTALHRRMNSESEIWNYCEREEKSMNGSLKKKTPSNRRFINYFKANFPFLFKADRAQFAF